MQWTLRSMLLGTAIAGYCLAGAMTYGLVATLTSIAILGAAWFLNSRLPSGRQGWPKRWALAAVTVVILYGATFFAFRLFHTFEFSLARSDDPQRNLVIFSMNPKAQELARQVYSPLMKWIPGHCVYPTGEQMELLNRNPFTGDSYTLYW